MMSIKEWLQFAKMSSNIFRLISRFERRHNGESKKTRKGQYIPSINWAQKRRAKRRMQKRSRIINRSAMDLACLEMLDISLPKDQRRDAWVTALASIFKMPNALII